MNMKDMIQRMTDIETEGKTQLIESQQLAECPPDMAEGPMQQGAPVSMNVSLNASGMDHVADLISLMKNAGLDAKPAGDVIMPMRHDIEKFRAAIDDDPKIPGRDDIEGDQDLQQGIVGSALGGIGGALAGGALGAATGATGALGSAVGNLGSKAGGALAKAMGKGALGQMAGRAAGSAVGKAIPSAVGGAIGSEVGDRITGKEKEESIDELEMEADAAYSDFITDDENLDEGIDPKALMGQIRKMAKGVETSQDEREHRIFASQVESDLIDLFQYYNQVERDTEKQGIVRNLIKRNKQAQRETDRRNANNMVSVLWDLMNANEAYNNEPEPEYRDHKYMTKDLSGGINREKKAYKAAQRGDNAMAVEAIKAQLIAALAEKKDKPDFLDTDKDGNKKEPMKKALKDKKKKGAVKEGSTGDYSAKKARAGKDIGKPGKNFAKIAKSAGEKYGSKERGEKVAGAVLAKLRK